MHLPIDDVLPNLLQTLRQHCVTVLQAPPGAGKTTRVPLALLAEPWLDGQRIIMLEPRRLAARAAAQFMAQQLGEPVGQTVGYRTRLDSKVSAQTRIEVVTEGILTRILQDDPSLAPYGAVLFDEFHERSLQADLGLALTLEVRQALREDLRLVVMSATLDAEPIAKLLGNAPMIVSPGRSYPVEVCYLPAPGHQTPQQHLVAVVLQALAEQSGSVLVFLPGAAEISRLQQELEGRLASDTFVAPLFGQLSQDDQDAAIRPAPAGRRKVVLATSIAETSLTIEGVRVVIDSGLHRAPVFDPVTGLTHLHTQRISQAAAEQRKGRAGRTEPGVCYRLWSEAEQSRLIPFAQPEIVTADLSDLVMDLAQWGETDPTRLSWLNAPPPAAWQQARELLQQLQILGPDGRLTDHGRRVGRLGLQPRLAHMVERARDLGWARLGAQLAALLSERDVLTGQRHGDVQDRLVALRGEVGRGVADRGRVQRVRQTTQQILQRLKPEQNLPESPDAAGVLLAMAYPDRIGKRRAGNAPRYLLANGRGAWLMDDDPLQRADFIVAAELDDKGREARIFLGAEISRASILEHFADRIEHQELLHWDATAQLVRAAQQTKLGALVLEERAVTTADPEAVTALLTQVLVQRKLEDLPWDDESRQWLARVQFLRRFEGDVWPDTSLEALAGTADQWLAPFLAGMNRLTQVKGLSLLQALNSLLSYDQQRQLELKAPARLEVPTGSRIQLDYRSAELPVLAVRLQELFGLTETPKVLDGRQPVTLHLLSPGYKPVQVTQDLTSFWRNGYREVRKDLRGRYPKHHWPEDPLTAPPTRHAKRRGESG